jgi:O-succinylbenzoate synthase
MDGVLKVIDMLGRTIIDLQAQLEAERAAKDALVKQLAQSVESSSKQPVENRL